MKRKILTLLLMLCLSAGIATAQEKSQAGTYDIILDKLLKEQESCKLKAGALNKKIVELEKQQVKFKKISLNRKLSEKEFDAEVKKREDTESEIDALVISLAEAQEKIELAQSQILEYQERKEEIEMALDLEAVLGATSKYQVKRMTRDEMAVRSKREQDSASAYAEYRISAHDELQVNVYGEPDLTKTVRVAVDGSISYPLLGKINVNGLTSQQLEEKLGKLLSDGGYIVNPQVSVYVERFSSVSILGEVRNPGSYELKGRLGIMDAVAQAGGFNIDADINNVKVLRVEDGQQRTIQLKLGDIKKGIESAEIVLRANDTIFVEKIGKVTVLGEVSRPGTFELKDKLTVLEAIAMAGGFTDIAAINSTRVIRQTPGSKKRVFRIHVTAVTSRGKKEKDIELLPGDMIYVPETFF